MANFINKDKDHFKYGINEWTGEANKPVFYTKEMSTKMQKVATTKSTTADTQ